MPGDGAAAKNGAKPERAREINIVVISVRRSGGPLFFSLLTLSHRAN